MKELIIAGGCFWGMEELFREQPGVVDTEVGYAGGENDHPTYENHPGHAEALEITYDPSVTNESQLYEYFFQIHDPTTMNRQGNDIGSSYRSSMFYTSEAQKEAAQKAIQKNQVYWEAPIVTRLEQLTTFWPAEDYHQDYLRKNPGGYTCHYERAR